MTDHKTCCDPASGALPTEGVAIDPVCGMSVTIAGAEHSAEHDGARHYFCSAHCQQKFATDPEMYLSGTHLQAVEDLPEGSGATGVEATGSGTRVASPGIVACSPLALGSQPGLPWGAGLVVPLQMLLAGLVVGWFRRRGR